MVSRSVVVVVVVVVVSYNVMCSQYKKIITEYASYRIEFDLLLRSSSFNFTNWL